MAKASFYSAKGVKKPTISLPKIFSEKENEALLAQAMRVYEAKLHSGLAKVKTRGEVKASKRKIWRQKGTGKARHGARSAPIFVGGGKAHGPTGLKRQLTLPRKMRQKALNVALSMKAKAGLIVVVDDISSWKKTSQAQNFINEVVSKEKETKDGQRATFVLADNNLSAKLVLRNIPNVEVISFKNINAHHVFFGGKLIFDKEVLKK